MISVIIPFYNEENRLPDTLERVLSFFDASGRDYEIILVNDGSTDGTVHSVYNYFDHETVQIIHHEYNAGKGAAIQTGVRHARGDYIFFTDADLSTPINEFARLFSELEKGKDLVIASRALRDSRIITTQPVYRQRIGRIGNVLIQKVLGLPFYDTQCGFKLFRGDVARSLFDQLTIKRWGFDYEVLYLAYKEGYSILEIGVEWHDSQPSRFHPIKDSARCFFDLLKIKKRH